MNITEIQAVDFDTALKRIIQTANSDSLLAKGIHEVSKALESKDEKVKAKYVILAKNCTEANYVKIVKGLAAQNKVMNMTCRFLSMRWKREKFWENGWELAKLTRTATWPRKESVLRWQSDNFRAMWRRSNARYSLLNWADDGYMHI